MNTRRNFIRSLAGIFIAAPMVVRAENIMRVRPEHLTPLKGEFGIIEGFTFFTSPGVTVREIDYSDVISNDLYRSDPVLMCDTHRGDSATWQFIGFGPVKYEDDYRTMLDNVSPSNKDRLRDFFRIML